MELKCLIRLLSEKDIIKHEESCKFENKTVMSVFKFEYEEVFEKIVNSKYDKTNIYITKAHYNSNMMCILNVANLQEALVHIGNNRESFGFNKSYYGLKHIGYKNLRYIIDENTRFCTDCEWDFNEDYIQVIDEYLKEEKINREINKKKEVIDFLNQLP